jgi:neutral ceramidase
VLFVLSSTGCTILSVVGKLSGDSASDAITVPGYEVRPPSEGQGFIAGAGKKDITPPPGFPTGGHGPAGNLSRGTWSRLYARAFFFRDQKGRALLMVSCDLFAIPGGLQASAARKLAVKFADRVSLPPESVVVAATHTHQSPGNFITSKTYNEYGSNYPGFSRSLFDFLEAGIVAAGSAAIEDALSSSGRSSLVVHGGRVHDLFKNRSPFVFNLNRDREAVLSTLNPETSPEPCKPRPGEPKDGWDLSGCPRLRAVDPTLTVLEIRRGSGATERTIGVLSFFAVHPTVLEHDAPFYGSDFVGFALTALERRFEGEAIVGFFNGPEGDVSARRTTRDFADVERLGRRLKADLEDVLFAPGVQYSDPEVAVRGRTIDVNSTEDLSCSLSVPASQGAPNRHGSGSARRQFRLSDTPTYGTAALGGGEDDRSGLYSLGWHEGVRDRPLNGQGPKQPALDAQLLRAVTLTDSFAPKKSFPGRLPLVQIRIGPFQIVTIPAELSTTQGLRIRRLLDRPPADQSDDADGLGADFYRRAEASVWLSESHKRLAIVGLSNEYTGYVATADEYLAQDYMGASTIWGRDEGAFFGCVLYALDPARAVEGQSRVVREVAFDPGPPPPEAFGPRFCGDPRRAPDEELEGLLTCADGTPERHAPWFGWTESLDDDGSAGASATDFAASEQRSVSIWGYVKGEWRPRSDPDQADDDTGFRLVTVLLCTSAHDEDTWSRRVWSESCTSGLKVPGGKAVRRWGAIWRPPLDADPSSEYRFRVRRPDGSITCSRPFSIGDPEAGGEGGLSTGDVCPGVALQ